MPMTRCLISIPLVLFPHFLRDLHSKLLDVVLSATALRVRVPIFLFHSVSTTALWSRLLSLILPVDALAHRHRLGGPSSES